MEPFRADERRWGCSGIGGGVEMVGLSFMSKGTGVFSASLLSTKYVEDLNVWLQKDVEAKIITVEPEEQRLVLSAKAVEKEKRKKRTRE